ncbi:hypothetical protein PISMIDRAFT_688996 [Pisolithus microcarpus 441]|uniref:Uncharacterized protein n=1 Tax=Pisolithus microcarpus 441 TaxID=765257 RepID=A0A0C9YYY3_9AGAM|nr:hypothetical protein PISMIDRAFT_688996 [Pisolithus microcarpus 441]
MAKAQVSDLKNWRFNFSSGFPGSCLGSLNIATPTVLWARSRRRRGPIAQNNGTRIVPRN